VKVYEAANLRNLALIGHGRAGKTTLVSAMLYTAGAAPRLGRVDDGNTTTDYDEEEIARKMSLSAGLPSSSGARGQDQPLDTPGFNMFVHEAKMVAARGGRRAGRGRRRQPAWRS
jgi:elongation factor G